MRRRHRGVRAHPHGGRDRAEQQRGPTGTGRNIPVPISSNIHRCRIRCHRIPIFVPPCPISTAFLPAVHARTQSHVNSHARHRDAVTLATTTTMCNRVHSYAFREYIYECKHICTVECARFCAYRWPHGSRRGALRLVCAPRITIHLDRCHQREQPGPGGRRDGRPHRPPGGGAIRPDTALRESSCPEPVPNCRRRAAQVSRTAEGALSGNAPAHRAAFPHHSTPSPELVRERINNGNSTGRRNPSCPGSNAAAHRSEGTRGADPPADAARRPRHRPGVTVRSACGPRVPLRHAVLRYRRPSEHAPRRYARGR